jgi:hypothetical protein
MLLHTNYFSPTSTPLFLLLIIFDVAYMYKIWLLVQNEQTKVAITALNQNATTDAEKTYDGGVYLHFLDWYRNTFPNPNLLIIIIFLR